MNKYIEIGIGNTWLVRTEFEDSEGNECEEKGIVGKVKVKSIYMRVWLRKKVLIVDSKEGIKVVRKKKNKFKLVFGIKSES